jgi:hypothetical protein
MSPSVGSEAGLTPTMFAESPTVEEYVREYFDGMPVLAEVARCESRFRHFNTYGDILRGEANSYDVGVMQINEHYHLKQANKLGYDLYSLDGNLGYAKYLFEKEGTQPWKASSKCWGLENHVAVK